MVLRIRLADPSAPEPETPITQSVPDSVSAEIRRMYAYLVELFPQAAGAPSAPPPPRALFEDFLAASASPHQLVFLSWFERVRTALAEADSRLASLLASGRVDSSILPQRVTQYAFRGEFAAVPVNPSLLSMFERSLRPSLQLGISLREAALLESSRRFHSEALSHSLWLLSGLLAFVRLQGFSPSDASLFNTMVTSLSKCLAHQALLTASQTAFLGLKCRQFYLSHLPAYFSDANKRTMLAAPVVCADSLFAEADVAQLLADTQTSSSLRSQQALVDVASRGSGVRRRRSSPARSPAWSSPACRRRRDSASPSRQNKRVCFDSPAPVRVGLRQGCVMSPWLFNLYIDGVVREVNARVLGRGLKLVDGNENEWELNQLLFADDTVVVADSERKLCQLVTEFGRVCERRKLLVNVGKSKVMRCAPPTACYLVVVVGLVRCEEGLGNGSGVVICPGRFNHATTASSEHPD